MTTNSNETSTSAKSRTPLWTNCSECKKLIIKPVDHKELPLCYKCAEEMFFREVAAFNGEILILQVLLDEVLDEEQKKKEEGSQGES